MIVDGIHKYNGIHFFQRTFLPFLYNRQDFVCDSAYCAVRNINIIHFTHVRFNVSGGHSFGIHGNDLLINIGNIFLTFFHNLWFKR